MNDSIKREQSELAHAAERENLRPKGKKIINPHTSSYTVQLNVKSFDERSGKADYRKAVPTTEPEHTIRAKVSKQVRNLAYISAEITNSKGELCNEGEAVYFLMRSTFGRLLPTGRKNEEKAKEMGFLHCEVDD